MNQSQYTTLLDVLAVIPAPRKARGRYPWPLVLTLLAAGLASGQQTMRAIAQWVHLHADSLRAALSTLTSLPSESTLLRTARQIDVGILETAIAQLTQPRTEVAQKRNEITAVPDLMTGRDLTDTVVTMDALLTQRALAQQMIDQGGQYLMIVKRNQP